MKNAAIFAGVWLVVQAVVFGVVYARRTYWERRRDHARAIAEQIRQHQADMAVLAAEVIYLDAAHNMLATGRATPAQIVHMFQDGTITPNTDPKETP